MEGEVGRFDFKTYDVKSTNKTLLFEGISLFPKRRGLQWYPTCGFKEIALICGAAQRSYRQTVQVFNYSRRQEIGGTPLNTLRDVAQREGLKVLDFLTRQTQRLFKQHHFNANGMPEADCAPIEPLPETAFLTPEALQPALDVVVEDMIRRELKTQIIDKVKKNAMLPNVYEQTEHTVYVHIDDVGVKEQKPHREKKALGNAAVTTQPESTKNKRPTVQNTVAYIAHAGKHFTLSGRSVAEVLRFVLAFLLNNHLHHLALKCCTDGQRHLQDSILAFLSWHPSLSLLLDWFHLVKKFKEDLSLACKGREIRNRHLQSLLTLLWFGLVDNAQAYLATIPSSEIKDRSAIERLSNYLERNEKWIPCYAMRRQLQRPNSSNPVERCNNQITAHRQKHQGMSWSENGSYALTALNTLTVNRAARQWVENRSLPFVLLDKAA